MNLHCDDVDYITVFTVCSINVIGVHEASSYSCPIYFRFDDVDVLLRKEDAI